MDNKICQKISEPSDLKRIIEKLSSSVRNTENGVYECEKSLNKFSHFSDIDNGPGTVEDNELIIRQLYQIIDRLDYANCRLGEVQNGLKNIIG